MISARYDHLIKYNSHLVNCSPKLGESDGGEDDRDEDKE